MTVTLIISVREQNVLWSKDEQIQTTVRATVLDYILR